MKNQRQLTRLNKGLIAFLGLIFWPSPAAAHLVTTGLGPVYDGIGHLVMTPEDLIPALALAVFAGQRGSGSGKWALFFLPLAWFIGGLGGVFIDGLPSVSLSALSFLVLGVLIALDMNLSRPLVTSIIIGVGFVHGVMNGIALKEGPSVLGLIGIAVTLFVIVAIVSQSIVSLKKPWAKIMVRVAGSWITAMGMLMFAWMVRGQG
jgi:urease accessory protein